MSLHFGTAMGLDGCPAVLAPESTLLDHLPKRLRDDLESSRIKFFLSQNSEARTALNEKMDHAFIFPGTNNKIQFGNFEINARFERKFSGEMILHLSEAKLAESGGYDFLKFIASEVEWLKTKESSQALKKLQIIGDGILGSKNEKFFSSLGFKQPRTSKNPCIVATVVGGMTGALAGGTYFKFFDDSFENESIYEQQRRYQSDLLKGGGAGLVVGAVSFCIWKKNPEFSLTVF